MIKKIFLVCVLSSLCYCSLSAEQSYYITETQLTEMENLTKQQSELIQTQKTQIEDLNKQIKNYQTFLQKSEIRNTIKNNLITVLLGISVGCAAGVITYNVCN